MCTPCTPYALLLHGSVSGKEEGVASGDHLQMPVAALAVASLGAGARTLPCPPTLVYVGMREQRSKQVEAGLNLLHKILSPLQK